MRVAGSPEILCRLPKGSSVLKPRSRLCSCIAHALKPRIIITGHRQSALLAAKHIRACWLTSYNRKAPFSGARLPWVFAPARTARSRGAILLTRPAPSTAIGAGSWKDRACPSRELALAHNAGISWIGRWRRLPVLTRLLQCRPDYSCLVAKGLLKRSRRVGSPYGVDRYRSAVGFSSRGPGGPTRAWAVSSDERSISASATPRVRRAPA